MTKENQDRGVRDASGSREPSSSCERVRHRLTELLDGGLAPIEEARDSGHLEACASCRAESDELELMLETLVPATTVESELDFAMAGLNDRLALIPAPTAVSGWQRLKVSTLLPLAAAALALIAIRTLSQDDASPANSLPSSWSGFGASVSEWGQAFEELMPTIDLTDEKES